jgi:hypothetical protein
MRIISSVVTAVLVAVALATLAASPAPSADSKPAIASAEQSGEMMDGCPGKAGGAPCCAGCQEKQAKVESGAAAQPSSGGCPCKERARRLREAQARAKQQ